MLTIEKVVHFLIDKGPGRTEAELSNAIFGGNAPQQRVNQECRLLNNRGVVERRGDGGPADPFRYFPRATQPTSRR